MVTDHKTEITHGWLLKSLIRWYQHHPVNSQACEDIKHRMRSVLQILCCSKINSPDKNSEVCSTFFSSTSQGYCYCQMELAAHLPGLHLHLQRLVSSRCKPQAPAPGKKNPKKTSSGQADDCIKRTGPAKCYYRSQMSCSFPATCSACHHSRSRFPPLLLLYCPLPVIALSLTPSVFLLPWTDIFFHVCISRRWFLCHCQSLQLLKTHYGAQRHIWQGHVTIVSPNITQRTSGALCTGDHLYCAGVQNSD